MRTLLLKIIFSFSSLLSFAQLQLPEVLLQIKQQLAQNGNVSYNYLIEQKLDDGSINKATGQIRKAKDYYFESNEQQQVIQTQRWFYKVDHSSRTVYVIDLEKVRNNIFKAKGRADAVNLIPDSVLLKYGSFDVKHEKDLVKVNIGFSKEVLVKNIYIEYNNRLKQLMLMKVNMLIPYAIDGWSYEDKYIDQVFTANKFSTGDVKKGPDMGDYFTISRGRVILKKYGNYELITEV